MSPTRALLRREVAAAVVPDLAADADVARRRDGSTPARASTVVVLPPPLGPRMPMTWPGSAREGDVDLDLPARQANPRVEARESGGVVVALIAATARAGRRARAR